MGTFFSKSKEKKNDRISEVDLSILQLKTQRDKLDQQYKRLEKQIAEDDEAVRRCIHNKNYEKGKLILCLKKLHNKNLNELTTHILQIQQLLLSIETAQMQADVVHSLESGNAALSQIQKNQSVDFVQKIVDDFYELNAYVEDVHALLNNNGISNDDEEVVNELNALMNAEKEKEESKKEEKEKEGSKKEEEEIAVDGDVNKNILRTSSERKKENKQKTCEAILLPA